jgi:hypothetical protein
MMMQLWMSRGSSKEQYDMVASWQVKVDSRNGVE